MKKLALLLLLVGVSQAGWRWSRTPVFTDPDADLCHAVGSAYLAASLEQIGFAAKTADKVTIGLGLAWEVKDALVPLEKHKIIGGDGFSFGDLTCNICGVVSNRAFQAVLKKVKADKRKRHTLRYDWSKEKFKCGD